MVASSGHESSSQIKKVSQFEPFDSDHNTFDEDFFSMYRLFSSMAKECMDAGARGERLDCFVNQFYNSELGKKLDQDLKTFMLADLMQGGTDTTYASSSIIFAGLARYPRTVLRAREELDRVCGFHAERLPTFRDRADLPCE